MRSWALVLFLLLSGCSSVEEHESAQERLEDILSGLARDLVGAENGVTGPIAVGDFLTHGCQCDLGAEIEARLPKLLHRADPGLDIVSHHELEAILERQALQTGDLYDSSGVQPGELLPARSMAVGFLFPDSGGTLVVAHLVEVGTARNLFSSKAYIAGRQPRRLDGGSQDGPLEVSFQILARKAGYDGELVVREGEELRSGDQVRLVVKPNRPAHLYVFFIDSQGRAHLLHPDSPGSKSRIEDAEVRLPADRAYFRLDNHPGTESLLVAAALEPLGEVESLLGELDAITGRREVVIETVESLGIKGLIGVSEPSGPDGQLPDVLRSYGGAVWKLVSFEHLP